jgi:hypothetical protein
LVRPGLEIGLLEFVRLIESPLDDMAGFQVAQLGLEHWSALGGLVGVVVLNGPVRRLEGDDDPFFELPGGIMAGTSFYLAKA